MNYFAPKNAAERYANGRPNFHSKTVDKIKIDLNITNKLDRALDVACGTGLSTNALLAIARNVYGTDSSEEMLKNAITHKRIHYSAARAEKQPFRKDFFDLITVCSAIHWFQIDDFLAEANRLLKKDGSLVLYDNFFLSEMKGNSKFSTWFPDIYLQQFPSPPRNNDYIWENDVVRKSGMQLQNETTFKNEVQFTKTELILYFTTQSNITAAVQRGRSYEDIENWLNAQLTPFFETESVQKTFAFGNWVKYLKRI